MDSKRRIQGRGIECRDGSAHETRWVEALAARRARRTCECSWCVEGACFRVADSCRTVHKAVC